MESVFAFGIVGFCTGGMPGKVDAGSWKKWSGRSCWLFMCSLRNAARSSSSSSSSSTKPPTTRCRFGSVDFGPSSTSAAFLFCASLAALSEASALGDEMNGIFETGGEDGRNDKFRMGVRPTALGVVAVFFVGVSA